MTEEQFTTLLNNYNETLVEKKLIKEKKELDIRFIFPDSYNGYLYLEREERVIMNAIIISYNDGRVTIRLERVEEQLQGQFLEEFIKQLRHQSLDVLVHPTSYQPICSLVAREKNGEHGLLATGPISEAIVDVMNELNIKQYRRLVLPNVTYHTVCFKVDQDSLQFEVYRGVKSESNYHATYTTKEAFCDFYRSLQEESANLQSILDELIDLIKSYIPSAYYDRNTLLLFERAIPFTLYKDCEKNKYIANTLVGKRRNGNLTKLIEKVKKETIDYLKRNRVKAVLEGRNNDYVSTLFTKAYGYSIDSIPYDDWVISSFTKENLNTHLQPFIQQATKTPMDKPALDWFTLFIRFKGSRNKIKRGYTIGDLYFVFSSSKLFIYTVEEVLTFDTNVLMKKNKKYAAEIEALTDWKNKELERIKKD